MNSRALTVIIICLFLSALCAQAQEGGGQLVVPLESAGFVAFKIETVPSGSPVSNGSTQAQELVNPRALKGEHHVIHRVLADADGDFVFGYDLTVEPLANAKQFKVAVGPLSPEFTEQLRAGNNPGGNSIAGQVARPHINVHTISRATESQIIDDGDAFALDLLINQQTGVKIVDMVKVSFDRAKLRESPAGEQYPIRDFTLANVELAVRDYKLLLNDEQVAGGKPTRGCEGALVWFYVPGKGRFIFSLIPHQGYDFRKVGVIEDNKISFTLGNDHYEWISSAPVVGNGGNWNVWVLVDSTYIPIPEFYPPAKDSAVASRGGIKQAGPPFLSQLLGGVFPSLKDRNKAGHPVKQIPESAQKPDQIPNRVRVSIGAADRIENLWPKN
jgi:hypothetical protein